MASILPTTVPSKRLAASMNASAMSFQLNNILGWNGSALTSADFGTKAYGVFRNPQNTLLELFEYDPSTIASASITILRRGLKFTGDLTTEVSANKLTWVRNETIVELGSDVPQLLAHMVRIVGSPAVVDQLQYSTELTPTDRKDIVTKGYVDDSVNGGPVSINAVVVAGTAGETVAANELLYFDQTDDEWKKTDADTIASLHNVKLGIAMGAGTNGNSITGGVHISGLLTGLSGLTAGDSYYASNTAGAYANTVGTIRRKIGVAKSTTELYFDPEIEKVTYDEVRRNLGIFATDSVGTDAYAVTLSPAPTQYSTGMIVTFKAGTANTGACSLNVNTLGAITLKKNVSEDLGTNDIAVGQIVTVIYDGTNFQVISNLAQGDVQTFNASGTWTKPGKGTVAFIECWGAGGSGGARANGADDSASGGGGGGYNSRLMALADLGTTVTVTIGAGGAAVSGTNPGNAGGNTTFGAHLTGYGGGRGYEANGEAGGGGGGGPLGAGGSGAAPGAGTAGSPGSPVAGVGGTAAAGGSGLYSGGGGAATGGVSGAGGSAFYGGAGGGGVNDGAGSAAGGTSVLGGAGGASGDGVAGTAGTQPGGGGGASFDNTSGAGGDGRVKVTVY